MTQLPTLNKEVQTHGKKMEVLSRLEELTAATSAILKETLVECPFGHDCLDFEQLINVMLTTNIGCQKAINELHNDTVNRHISTVEILLENENLKEPTTEDLEDTFASIKSNVVPELEASRVVRSQDAKKEKEFNAKLAALTKEFMQSDRTSVVEAPNHVE